MMNYNEVRSSRKVYFNLFSDYKELLRINM